MVALIRNHLPKRIVRDKYFRRAFKPRLSNDKQVTTRINAISSDLRGRVLSRVRHKTVTLPLDMWTNKSTKAKILNMLLLNPDDTFFWKVRTYFCFSVVVNILSVFDISAQGPLDLIKY